MKISSFRDFENCRERRQNETTRVWKVLGKWLGDAFELQIQRRLKIWNYGNRLKDARLVFSPLLARFIQTLQKLIRGWKVEEIKTVSLYSRILFSKLLTVHSAPVFVLKITDENATLLNSLQPLEPRKLL